MKGKITWFMREYIFGLSVIATIIGVFLAFMGVSWYWIRDMVEGNTMLAFIENLGDWNAYFLVIGLILLGIGIYYIYVHIKNKKFVLEELTTNKRSEFMKKHSELKVIVKRMPSKYQSMVKEKEEVLNVK